MWLARKETPDCEVVVRSQHPTLDAAKKAIYKMAGQRVALTGDFLVYSDVIDGYRYTAVEVGGNVWQPSKTNPWS